MRKREIEREREREREREEFNEEGKEGEKCSYLDVLLKESFLAGPSECCGQIPRGYRGVSTLR